MPSKFIRSIFRPFVPEPLIPSIWHTYFKHIKGGRFAHNDLDKKLEKYLDYHNGFYVELGANDGFTQSNTYYFELKRGWHGILIEPAPNLFLSCVRFRGNEKNSIYCNACVGFNYTQKYVDIEYANVMSISSSLDLDILDKTGFLASGRAFLRSKCEAFSFGARARTLNSILLDSHAPKKIDLLSLDVEGAELEVLKGIDFNEFQFKYMLIECRDIVRLSNYLTSFGYIQIEKLSDHDYLFAPK